jgi:glucose/arabinose dehydrogenase
VVRFGPDGKLYFAIGAPCNICQPGTFQASPTSAVYQYGSLYRMNPDGTGMELVASGIRNTVGFDFHPDTGVPYFSDNGRDNWNGSGTPATDNTPDCELNAVTAPGQFFGYPYCHTVPSNGNPYTSPYRRPPGASAMADPIFNAGESVMKCTGPNQQFRVALQAMGPHTAPLGLRFYRWFNGANFPKSYNNSILIAHHGSWNRNNPIGARVMRVILDPADPLKVLHYVPFLCGGVPGDTCLPGGPVPPSSRANPYKGRPVDVQQLPDGSLLVSDNQAHTVYRIAFASLCGRSV